MTTLKLWAALVIIGLGWAVIATFLYVTILAVINGGTVELDYTRFGELWPETVGLAIALVAHPWALLHLLRRGDR
jgi:hypothetical protein